MRVPTRMARPVFRALSMYCILAFLNTSILFNYKGILNYVYTRVTVFVACVMVHINQFELFAVLADVAGREKVLPLDPSSARARGSQPTSNLHFALLCRTTPSSPVSQSPAKPRLPPR